MGWAESCELVSAGASLARDTGSSLSTIEGSGTRATTPRGPGRAAFVDDLEGLLDSLGVQEAALVAQSMGGWTLLGYSMRHPERVKALVMADTLGGISEPVRLPMSLRGSPPRPGICRSFSGCSARHSPAATLPKPSSISRSLASIEPIASICWKHRPLPVSR